MVPLEVLTPAKSFKKLRSNTYVEVINLQDPMRRSGLGILMQGQSLLYQKIY